MPNPPGPHGVILGLSAFYHDSAICFLSNGEILFAAQEERYSRIKNDRDFPRLAFEAGLRFTGKKVQDIDRVAYYDKPLLTFDRLLETWLSYAPRGFKSFSKALPVWLNEKLFLPAIIRKNLPGCEGASLSFMGHHRSHAASAFYPSPHKEAAILTIDGVGEWSTTSIGHGLDNKINLLQEIRFPHSLGLLYSAFTYYLGFRVNSAEYKVMGLAPYGTPIYAKTIHAHLLTLKPDGSFCMDMRYFNYCQGLTMTNDRFHNLFGGPPRSPDEPLTKRHMDLAASIQKVYEDILLALARHAREVTRADALCLAGGCALNCVANGLLLREKIFKHLFIQPAAGDAGGAMGAALLEWHEVMDQPRLPHFGDTLKGSFLGDAPERDDIKNFLDSMGALYEEIPQNLLPGRVADLLSSGRVVGYVQGRMEFGPRALGGRSILGDPRQKNMHSQMNVKIKFRESFRPFAPAIMQEHTQDFFDLPTESPYMLLVASVLEQHRRPPERSAPSLEEPRTGDSVIPAVTHVDFSARVQTVSRETNQPFHDVLKAFYKKTGCPLLINTSFNIRGEPIVSSPEDAYRCFMYTDMDALVIEHFVMLKERQPPLAGAEEYKKMFQKRD